MDKEEYIILDGFRHFWKNKRNFYYQQEARKIRNYVLCKEIKEDNTLGKLHITPSLAFWYIANIIICVAFIYCLVNVNKIFSYNNLIALAVLLITIRNITYPIQDIKYMIKIYKDYYKERRNV